MTLKHILLTEYNKLSDTQEYLRQFFKVDTDIAILIMIIHSLYLQYKVNVWLSRCRQYFNAYFYTI